MTPPNNVPGTAYGTLTVSDPSTLTLDITWTGLTSAFVRVGCGFQITPSSGLGFDFFPPTNMPTSGHWTDTEVTAAPASEWVQAIELGHSQVQINTLNYPYDGYGEIAGLINPSPVPEPSGVGLAMVAGGLSVTFRRLRKVRLLTTS